MAPILMATMMLLASADSRMPRTSRHRQDEDDQKCGDVEVGARPVARLPDRRRPSIGQVEAERCELRLGVGGEADGHDHVADDVFEDEVPADDPGEDFAQRRVGVGVGAAGDGNHRGQFGVAESGKAAGHGDQEERDGNRRTGRRAAVHEDLRRAAAAQEVHDDVEHLGVEDGRRLEVFSGSRGAGEHEDAGADDRADAERGQRPRAQRFLQALAGVSDSEISLSIDLQQNSWLSEVRMVGGGFR